MPSNSARSAILSSSIAGLTAFPLVAVARQDCTPMWQSPLQTRFSGPTADFAMIDLDNTGRLTPVVCGMATWGNGGPVVPAMIFRNGAWSPLDPIFRGFGASAFMYDFDGAGPEIPQLVLAGAMNDQRGSPFSGIGRLTPQGWVGLSPAGMPSVFCAKVLDEDGDGPRPSTIYIGTNGAGIYRWNGADCDRLSFPVLGSHSIADLAVVDFDGLGPRPPILLGLGSLGVIANINQTWQVVAPQIDGGYRLAIFDPDADGPTPPSVYIPYGYSGLRRLDSDLSVHQVSIPDARVTVVASFAGPEGPTLAYFGEDAARHSIVRSSTNGVDWSVFADHNLFGDEVTTISQFFAEVAVGSDGRKGLALLHTARRFTWVSRLFLYGCHFDGGCTADFNADGFLDCFDYTDFVAAFEEGDPRADFNADAFADFFDYADFVLSFETGCD